MKHKDLITRFLGPLFLGYMLGLFSSYTEQEWIVRTLYTFSDNFLQVLKAFVPIIVFVYVATGINNIRDSLASFFLKYLVALFTTLLFCGVVVLGISMLVLPELVSPFESALSVWPESYFTLNLFSFNIFYTLIAGILIGIIFKPTSTVMIGITKLEFYIEWIIKKVLYRLIPLWILGSFAASGYSSSVTDLIIVDIILSILIIVLQFVFLFTMYFISSKYSGVAFKQMVKAGMRIYVMIVSVAGNGTGVIVPYIVEEEEKLGFNKNHAKFISASSFNMPGSLISHIVFMYGISVMYGLDLSMGQLLSYVSVLVFYLIASPGLPGAVFSITSQLLNPMLGFTDDMISIMNGFYWKQGTSNAAINNSADFYLCGFTHKKEKIRDVTKKGTS